MVLKNEIAVISPSSTLTRKIGEEVRKRELDFCIQQAAQRDAPAIAKAMMDAGVKVIISRGNTARVLRRQMNIPIVEVQHTFFDCYTAYSEARRISDRIAFLATSEGYERILNKSKPFLKDALIFPMDPTRGPAETSRKLDELAAKGIRVAVGGLSLEKQVTERGIQYVMSPSDADSINDAIDEALHLLGIEKERSEKNRELQNRYQMIRAILDAASDGIVSIDRCGRCTNFNSRVQSILGNIEIGQKMGGLFSSERIGSLLKTGDSISGEPVTYAGHPIIVNFNPIKVEKQVIGAVLTLQRQTEIQKAERRIRYDLLKKGYVADKTFADIIGTSPALERAKRLGQKYAQTDSTVLILGETGTGKELFAQSIHNASRRRNSPFVAINCAAFPPSLLESELFGYTKGAFTGALPEGKPGVFELAHGGTIFFDEISEAPLEVQLKLLRVIQERKVVRVGDDKVTPIDVRIISASNKDLQKQIRDGLFREDFYYRIAVLELKIPPLKERREDIAALVLHLLKNPKFPPREITPAALQMLEQAPWRGNVRELSNIVERLVVICEGKKITGKLVCDVIGGKFLPDPGEPSGKSGPASSEAAEAGYILSILRETRGNRKKAAQRLGVSTTTLWRRMKKIEREQPGFFNFIKY